MVAWKRRVEPEVKEQDCAPSLRGNPGSGSVVIASEASGTLVALLSRAPGNVVRPRTKALQRPFAGFKIVRAGTTPVLLVFLLSTQGQ
jgi:hypothetical protein